MPNHLYTFICILALYRKCCVLCFKEKISTIIYLQQQKLINERSEQKTKREKIIQTSQLVLFNPWIGPDQVLPFRARVNLGVMAMKGCSAFSKAPASLEPHHQIVQCHIQARCQMQLVYSTVLADWSIEMRNASFCCIAAHIQLYLYIHISSSSSCRAASTDIPNPLSPLLPIIHRLRQVFRVTSCVFT